MSDLDALFDNVSKSLIGILDKVAIHSKVHNTVSIDIEKTLQYEVIRHLNDVIKIVHVCIIFPQYKL